MCAISLLGFYAVTGTEKTLHTANRVCDVVNGINDWERVAGGPAQLAEQMRAVADDIDSRAMPVVCLACGHTLYPADAGGLCADCRANRGE